MSINIIAFFCSIVGGLLTILLVKLFVDAEYPSIAYALGGVAAGLAFVLVKKKLQQINHTKKQ